MTRVDRRFRSVGVLVRMTAGFVVWAAHFVVIYVVTALACARRFADLQILGFGIVPFTILLATLAALALNGLLVARNLAVHDPARPDLSAFARWLTVAIALASSLAVVLDALPTAFIDACSG